MPMFVAARLCVVVLLTAALLTWMPALDVPHYLVGNSPFAFFPSLDTNRCHGSSLVSSTLPSHTPHCRSPLRVDAFCCYPTAVRRCKRFPASAVSASPFMFSSGSVALPAVYYVAAVFVKADAARTFTVCAFASNSDLTTIALATKHAVEFYGQPSGGGFGKFPSNITYNFHFLGNGKLTRRNHALNFALATSPSCSVHGASALHSSTHMSCDALSGPGYSYLAVAMSPIVGPDTVWVDPYATSLSLSSKPDHPTFSRIIPNDNVGAGLGLALLNEFKWADVNILCFDEAYGRSVFQGLSEAVVANNGTIHVSKCFLNDATPSRMRVALEGIRVNSPSKLVLLAMITGPPFDRFIQTIVEGRYDEDLIFFFSDAACADTELSYGVVKSGLCVTYSANTTLLSTFYAAYKARNTTADEALLKSTGWTPPVGFSFTAESLLGALAHDSATHAMAALAARTPAQTAAQAVRSTVTVGATGRIVLDNNGDRVTADAVVYNTQGAPGQHRPIAYIREGRVYFSDTTGTPSVVQVSPPDMLLLGKRSSVVPRVVSPTVAPAAAGVESSPLLFTTIGVLVAVLATVAGSIGMYFAVTAMRRRTALARCPSDPSKPFSAFFISIKNEAVLRDEFSAESAETVCRKVEHMVDECAAKHSCHVAKKLDAHFLILSVCPRKALLCVAEILNKAQRYEWAHHAPVKRSAASSSSAIQTALESMRSSVRSSFDRSNRPTQPATNAGGLGQSQRSILSASGSTESDLASLRRRSSARSAALYAVSKRRSQQAGNPVAFCPTISVGCSHCLGTIAALSEAGCRVGEMPWRWGGAPIDQAASLADFAFEDQVLITEDMLEAVGDEPDGVAAGIGEFEEFCRRTLPGAKKPTVVFQLDVAGLPPRAYPQRSVSSSIDVGQGGVLTALEADAGGVNTRKVALVALYCTAFNKKDTLNAAVDQALVAASAAATPLKGKIAAVLDSALYITVNATGPMVSRAPSRAAAIATECVGVLSDVTGGAVYAGIEYGPCAVGTAPSVDRAFGLGTPGYVLTNTALSQNALMLAKIAETGPCAVVAGHSAYTDLEVGFTLRSVDIVGYAPRVMSSLTTAVEQPRLRTVSPDSPADSVSDVDGTSRTTFAELPPAAPCDEHLCILRMAHGVLETSSAGAEDDEWMYQLTDAESGNPFKLSNRAMAAILKGKGPNAQDATDDAVDFAAVEDGVVTALLEAIEQCKGHSFSERLRSYVVHKANRATARFPTTGGFGQ